MTESSANAIETISELCDLAARVTVDSALAGDVEAIRQRLDGPLRIAIAGRIKAGKSTLLNALVGERLAPTDAGECTRLVTLFRHGTGYEVNAVDGAGSARPLRFHRDEGALTIDLADQSLDHIDHLDVGWPARTLSHVTLIDTPGLESLNDHNSRRTREFLDPESATATGADAVIYLMRHLHRSDADFLGAFMDRSVMGASPVNAVAVLSRADEIGACRPDAMESTRRIADRYRRDPTLLSLVSDVVPVAGLIAETGLTLREEEFQQLGQLAVLPEAERARLLLSVDDFCAVELSPITAEHRRNLLERFGLFGVRVAIDALAAGRVHDSSELSRLLVETSGLAQLRQVIDDHFLPRARMLKARMALVALRSIGSRLAEADHPEAAAFAAAIDRADASTLDFAVLQAAHLVLSGGVRVSPGELTEVQALLDAPDTAGGVVASESSIDQQRIEALSGASRWRERTNDPLAGPELRTVADTMARVYEQRYAQLS